MTIKKAVKSDVSAIFNLISIGVKEGKVLPRSIEEITSVIDYFYVAWENDEIVGCCSLEVYSKKLAEMRSLVVLPSHQGKGIGSALIEACIKRAKEMDVYEVLAVTDKVSLFEKNGFSKQLSGQWPLFLKLK